MAFMIGAFLWAGATQALHGGEGPERLPALQARTLARPAIGVPADLPLSEAIRRAQEANAGSLVIVSSVGQPGRRRERGSRRVDAHGAATLDAGRATSPDGSRTA